MRGSLRLPCKIGKDFQLLFAAALKFKAGFHIPEALFCDWLTLGSNGAIFPCFAPSFSNFIVNIIRLTFLLQWVWLLHAKDTILFISIINPLKKKTSNNQETKVSDSTIPRYIWGNPRPVPSVVVRNPFWAGNVTFQLIVMAKYSLKVQKYQSR